MKITNTLAVVLVAILTLGLGSCSSGKGRTIEINSEQDLIGKTLSCRSGNYYERKFSRMEGVNIFGCNTDSDAIEAVKQGFADVAVTDEVLLTESRLRQLGLKKAWRGEEAFDVCFVLRKGDDATRNSINAFLSSMKEDGTLDAIINHWMKGTSAPEYPAAAETRNPEPLKVVVSLNMEPVCFLGEGGQWKGVDPDIAQRFAYSLGRPCEIKLMNMSSAMIALQTGKADIMCGCVFATDERRKNVDFAIPHFQCRPGYFVRDTQPRSRVSMAERFRMNLVTEERWKLIAHGLLETLKITILAILLGTVLGAGICALRRGRRKWMRTFASIYGAFFQGIPVLVFLLIMFYIIFANTGINASYVAVLTFALYFASSSGAIFDTSISSVPRGQMEAGLSLGFTPLRTFNGIIFPQALKKGLPLYTSECVAILKNSSIVGYIAIQDLTQASDLIRSRTYDALIPLLLVTILYFALAWIIRLTLNLLLKKK